MATNLDSALLAPQTASAGLGVSQPQRGHPRMGNYEKSDGCLSNDWDWGAGGREKPESEKMWGHTKGNERMIVSARPAISLVKVATVR